MSSHMNRGKILRDYPEINEHEHVLIAALTIWAPPGRPLPTTENLALFTVKDTKMCLRQTLMDRTVNPAAQQMARAALEVLKGDVYDHVSHSNRNARVQRYRVSVGIHGRKK